MSNQRRDHARRLWSVVCSATLVTSMCPATGLAWAQTQITEDVAAAPAIEQAVVAQGADNQTTTEETASSLVESSPNEAPNEASPNETSELAETTTGFGLTYVTGSTATTWDGATIDISWYNTTDKVFHITSAAQLIGLSAITSPLRGTLEEDLPKDATGEHYTLTGVASNAVDTTGNPIYVDTFEGKTVYLDVDIDINGGTSDATSTCDWWKPICDCNVYYAAAGGQGASISGSFDAVQWKGTFDGQGHTVSNLYDDGMSNTLLSNNFGGYQGMFNQIGVGGIIQNVGTTGYLKGRINGGICSQSAYTDEVVNASMQDWPRIQNCWSSVKNVNNGSSSRMSGGIFGAKDAMSVYCNIINCYSSSELSEGSSRAGIAGAANGVVAGCYFTGSVGTTGYTGAVVGTLYLRGSTCDGVTGSGIGAYVNNFALYTSTGDNGFSYRYVDASGSNSSPVGSEDGLVNDTTLKASASNLGDAYVEDTNNINNGYPILFCQAGLGTIDLSSATVGAIPDQQYSGKKLTPDVTVTLNGEVLTYGTDYLVDYQNNITGDANGNGQAVVFGVGRYTGELAAINFHIEATGLANTTISPISAQWRYPGDENSAVTPTLFVRDKDGNKLVEGTDYQVKYANNDAAGTATATIVAAEGSMAEGSNSIEFTIVNASESLAGSGTEADPYQISSKYDLQLLSHKVMVQDANYLGANYLVTADIDARKTGRTANDPEVSPIGYNGCLLHDPSTGETTTSTLHLPFNGVFDGGNHTITIAMSSASFSSIDMKDSQSANPYTSTYLGLFGVVGNADKTYTTETTIKNLTVDGSVTADAGYSGAAGVVGYSYYSTLIMENVTNKATVSVEQDLDKLAYGTTVPTTSLAGVCYEATIATFNGCLNEGTVASASKSYTAGILCYAYNQSSNALKGAAVSFTGCGNTGTISSSATTNGYGAGILAYNVGYGTITFSKCYNTGDITAAGHCAGIASGTGGGKFGVGALTVDQCYNTGNITNTYTLGAAGIVGMTGQYTYTVTNCYNTGNITATTDTTGTTTNAYAGGIVGRAYYATSKTGVYTVSNCYNIGTLTGIYRGDLTGQVCNSTTTANRGKVILEGYGTSGTTYSYYASNKNAATEEQLIEAGNIVNNGKQVTADQMKSADTITALGEYFKADGDGTTKHPINGGYPILAWQELGPDKLVGLAGDVNNNGKLNIVDAQITYDLSTNRYEGDPLSALLAKWGEGTLLVQLQKFADVNGDGTLDAADARAIQYAIHNGGVFGA